MAVLLALGATTSLVGGVPHAHYFLKFFCGLSLVCSVPRVHYHCILLRLSLPLPCRPRSPYPPLTPTQHQWLTPLRRVYVCYEAT
jgi:hypothetical protein